MKRCNIFERMLITFVIFGAIAGFGATARFVETTPGSDDYIGGNPTTINPVRSTVGVETTKAVPTTYPTNVRSSEWPNDDDTVTTKAVPTIYPTNVRSSEWPNDDDTVTTKAVPTIYPTNVRSSEWPNDDETFTRKAVPTIYPTNVRSREWPHQVEITTREPVGMNIECPNDKFYCESMDQCMSEDWLSNKICEEVRNRHFKPQKPTVDNFNGNYSMVFREILSELKSLMESPNFTIEGYFRTRISKD